MTARRPLIDFARPRVTPYLLSREQRILYIVPPKCGSTSVRAMRIARPALISEAREEVGADWTVIGCARHPYDRITSALFGHLFREGTTFAERYARYADDMHVRPQAPIFTGFKLDRFVPFERMDELFPARPHLNRGGRRPPRWQDVDFDWCSLNDRYTEDFALNVEWEVPR